LKDADRIKERVLLGVSVAAATGLVTATGLSTATGAGVASAPGAAATTTAAGASAVTTVATSSALAGKATLGAGLWKTLVFVGATAGLGGGAYLAASGNLTTSTAPLNQPGAAEPSPASRVALSDGDEGREAPSDARIPPPSEAEQEEAPQADGAPTTPAPRAPKKAEGSSTTDLKQEAALLQKAHAALQNGNTPGALAALSEHRAKYPRGVLAGEREAAFSVAYCKSGDLSQGRARAQAFIEKNPASPMVQRLRAACKLTSE